MRIVLCLFCICMGLATAEECRPGEGKALPLAEVSNLMNTPGYTSRQESALRSMGDRTVRALSAQLPARLDERVVAQVLLLIRLSFDEPGAIEYCTDRRPKASLELARRLAKLPAANQSEIENDLRMLNLVAEGRWNPNQAFQGSYDWRHTRWVAAILRSSLFIKPGMTRADLLAVFTAEGGLSNARQRTYVHRLCPYIKVAVEFSVAQADILNEKPDDVILKVSKPFLEYSVMD